MTTQTGAYAKAPTHASSLNPHLLLLEFGVLDDLLGGIIGEVRYPLNEGRVVV